MDSVKRSRNQESKRGFQAQKETLAHALTPKRLDFNAVENSSDDEEEEMEKTSPKDARMDVQLTGDDCKTPPTTQIEAMRIIERDKRRRLEETPSALANRNMFKFAHPTLLFEKNQNGVRHLRRNSAPPPPTASDPAPAPTVAKGENNNVLSPVSSRCCHKPALRISVGRRCWTEGDRVKRRRFVSSPARTFANINPFTPTSLNISASMKRARQMGRNNGVIQGVKGT